MKIERIGNIANFINGVAFKPEDWRDEGMKIIRIQNLTDSRKDYNYTKRQVEDKYVVHRGDVLVSWSATIDVFIWNDEPALLNQHIFKVDFNSKRIYKYYFIYALKYSINNLSKYAHGSTMKHVVKGDFENHKIPLPSLEDQIHIANLLSKAEELISQRKESIRLLDEFLKSKFLEMFGDYKEMSSKNLELLGNNISYLTSGSRGWAQYYSENGAKFLRIQNIGGCTIRTDNLIHVNPPNSAESERTRVKEGDLLISITADLGRTSVVPKNFGEAYINQHLALIRLNENINPIYAAYFYNMPFGNIAIQKKNRSAVKAGLNFNDIKSFPICIPPINLQNQFAQIVERTESLKAQYQSNLKELENLYGSLSQQAFKGELSKSKQEERVLLIADKLETSQKGKVIELELRKCDSSEKAILAGHIINSTNSEDFGRVKFQKLLYLTEHFCKIDLGSGYMQKAAGPYDGALIREIESTLKRFRFYDINQLGLTGNNRVNYTPLSSASELDILFEQNFKAESKKIDAFLGKFKNSTWEQCEIIATLYAVWNNRIIRQEPVTDELLKQDFLNWNKQKIKYKDRLDNALQWMRKEAIIPDGWGKLVQIENKI